MPYGAVYASAWPRSRVLKSSRCTTALAMLGLKLYVLKFMLLNIMC